MTDPGNRLKFEVVRVYPMAEVKDQKNVYKVRCRLLGSVSGPSSGLRPGMEGLGKIRLGRRSYAWLWTRKLVNWVRMRFWL